VLSARATLEGIQWQKGSQQVWCCAAQLEANLAGRHSCHSHQPDDQLRYVQHSVPRL